MKNRTIFSSILLAVLISAFFMSVSTVFGANPTGQPPAGLTAPMFSGIDLQGVLKNTVGNVVIDDTLDVRNDIQNTTGDLKINDTLDVVSGQITTSAGMSIKIKNLDVSGIFNSAGVISDPAAKLLELTDETHIVGPLLLHKKLPVTDVRAGEISSVEGQDVIINGSVVISGNNDGDKSEIKSDVATGLEIGSKATFTSITDVASAGTATLKFGTGTSWLGIDNNEISTYGMDLSLQYDSGKGVFIGSAITPSKLKLYGDLDVVGKVGNFYTKTAAKTTCNAGSSCVSSVACGDEEIAVSCGFLLDSEYPNVMKNTYVNNPPTTCFVNMKNTHTAANYLRATAVCFDSDG